MPEAFDDVGECVEATLRRLGKRIVMALPLALGKPVPFVNEIYRRALRDPTLQLKIFTAFSLRRPTASGEMEKRFLEPFAARVFGTFPELDYVAAVRAGELPPNVEVIEFFLETAAYLEVPYAQQHYLSANYTHVARAVLERGVNLIAQMVATREGPGGTRVSLSCNPDVTLDLLPAIRARRAAGHDVLLVGEANRNLPFMPGDAEIPLDTFDFMLQHPRYDFDLFGPPNMPIGTVDHMIGLYASALVRDGGTLQLGIGELGDSIVYSMQLRHQQNEIWRRVLDDTQAARRFGEKIAAVGGAGIFERGVYACSEMFVDGFLDLYRCGILKRRVYANLLVQRLLNERRISETLNAEVLDELVAAGLPQLINARDFGELQAVGVFDAECAHDGHRIRTPRGGWVPADLTNPEARAIIAGECIGRHLRGGVLLHGGFFLGPRGFYGALREMPEAELRQFNMTSVGVVNQIEAADIELRKAQRTDARFINSAMLMTLLGAAVSDQLDDGRVVSGVGGQYNFVAMAHSLPDARSIIAVRSTRTKQGRTTSNIVFSYGHATIPRHLRDIVITEYGIADLRGKTDAEVIAALLAVSDSRFQPELAAQAQRAGKLPRDFSLPEIHRRNTPEALEQALSAHRQAGLFSEYPFGTDFTTDEVVLARALKALREATATRGRKLKAVLDALLSGSPTRPMRPYLERMLLHEPRSLQERFLQRLLTVQLRKVIA